MSGLQSRTPNPLLQSSEILKLGLMAQTGNFWLTPCVGSLKDSYRIEIHVNKLDERVYIFIVAEGPIFKFHMKSIRLMCLMISPDTHLTSTLLMPELYGFC